MATQTAVKKGKKKTVAPAEGFAVELREPGTIVPPAQTVRAGESVRDLYAARLELREKAKAGKPLPKLADRPARPWVPPIGLPDGWKSPAPTVPSLEDSFKAIYAGQPNADALAAAAAKGREPGKLGQVYNAPPTAAPPAVLVPWQSSAKKEGKE